MKTDFPAFLRKPLGKLVSALTRLRNAAYDYDLLDGVRLSKPVISVGNLSMGGVGKTPFVAKLIVMCKERGLRPAVVSRNYKALSRGVHKVLLNYDHPNFNPASFYGDEPYMLASQFPDVPVFTGSMKYFTAFIAAKTSEIDILIIDDGFQHRALHRDFDIVLIDASRPMEENQIFPQGQAREDFSSLLRADLVVLTKTESADLGQLEIVKKQIPEGISHIDSRQRMLAESGMAPALAVAGIAHPEQFFSGLRELQAQVKGSLSFSDHHQYTDEDIEKILQEMRLTGAECVLTTEKDAVKLRRLKPFSDPDNQLVKSVHLEIEFLSEPRGLHAFLDQCASH